MCPFLSSSCISESFKEMQVKCGLKQRKCQKERPHSPEQVCPIFCRSFVEKTMKISWSACAMRDSRATADGNTGKTIESNSDENQWKAARVSAQIFSALIWPLEETSFIVIREDLHEKKTFSFEHCQKGGRVKKYKKYNHNHHFQHCHNYCYLVL